MMEPQITYLSPNVPKIVFEGATCTVIEGESPRYDCYLIFEDRITGKRLVQRHLVDEVKPMKLSTVIADDTGDTGRVNIEAKNKETAGVAILTKGDGTKELIIDSIQSLSRFENEYALNSGMDLEEYLEKLRREFEILE